jgi:zinc/manganese transport system ATP-binding protein
MTTPLVRLTGATGGYPGRPLWPGLTVDVGTGEFVTVFGGNGVGKTTLLRVLLGQLPLRAGHVRVFGRTPRRGNPRVGYIPQQRAFPPDIPLRGLDFVRLGLDGHRWGIGPPGRAVTRAVTAAVDSVDAGGYATMPVGRLSGGEQQRLRIAQALVADPALLLADEPLLSLDLASQQHVTALLDRRRRQAATAVVAVTHEINPVLPYPDRIVYLTDTGWAAGPPQEILTSATLSRLYRCDVDVLHVRGRLVIVGAPDAAHHTDIAGGR